MNFVNLQKYAAQGGPEFFIVNICGVVLPLNPSFLKIMTLPYLK
jgi:hypothetical protein